ncbi:alpha/beta hydrolase [Pseudotamlana carrageenivorans]|uniref:Alpha/beta hydrolase n=1 Tax=Pseudotamlana carrageenivorans TaxID=2069432 RepID=A0A2I7SE96_9FLAO|nr:alpha/beta hydrolase [Tamlana carrageenivorans]AUS04190.1 alpha/beta hydrolase [Tamlana carrageenivorans]
MIQKLIPVYFMPGMAASSKIFEYIDLPSDTFQMHFLEWILPLKDEPVSNYALRMTNNIKHENPVLIGVSFGGVLVQEMSKHIHLRKLIIVSSVKSKFELPKTMQLARTTGAYKIVPTQLAGKIDVLEKYAFGKEVTKRLALYKNYLSVNDPKYLSWAIKEMVCWNQESYDPDLIHIHGDNDPVFPIQYINNCVSIPEGTHIMIINKYRWFNMNLPKIILAE